MDFRPVESSTVDQIGYDPATEELHVKFLSGGYYIYSDVPAQVHRDFMDAPSKGRFVHQVLIARGYPCRKVR